jgi:hypothetical protein
LAHRDLVDLEGYLRAAIDDKGGRERLDRIVLYIDDLDRCDPDVVADVLDAVHLLLALPLFVVIVGVDPRWLKRSLRERHPELLSPTRSGVPSTSPADYLEKIFQLTYFLPHMSPDRCADLLAAAARETQRSPISGADPTSQEAEAGIEDIGGDADASFEDDTRPSRVTAENLADALTLREEDITALREIAPLVSISPRRAKRFLNTYFVIRARALGDPTLSERLGSNDDPPDNSLLVVLVALLLGLPNTMATCMRNKQDSNTSRAAPIGTWLSEMIQAATVPEEQARLQAFLNSEPSITTLPVDAVMQWLPLARPYLPLYLQEVQDHATGANPIADAHHETGESGQPMPQ